MRERVTVGAFLASLAQACAASDEARSTEIEGRSTEIEAISSGAGGELLLLGQGT